MRRFMGRSYLKDLEHLTDYEITKYRLILSKYPDAEYFFNHKNIRDRKTLISFRSKLVNKECDSSIFENRDDCLFLTRIKNIPFLWDDEEEQIVIYSSPKTIKLAEVTFVQTKPFDIYGHFTNENSKYVIRFNKIGTKKQDISEDILNQCKMQILKFIEGHSYAEINKDSLDPRLKKLIIFQ